MEPVAVVTAFVAVLYIVGRGGFVIAPRATAAFYRRTIFSTDERVRAFGGGLLVLVAAPLIITVHQAATAPRGILVLLEVLGWLAVAAGVLVVVVPGRCRGLAERMFSEASDSVLRTRGVLSVAFGLFLGWNSLFVL